ncbi:YhdP family protein [Massilia sp. CF038]|uniref:YhdP family protein n=1 Tax=Massilia sp. CF038 TaxID=1881045 RepID=UPI00091BBC02|nr:YhdP family protein [Massilia sp. CF038]SHH21508.1 TIGR02099 family protein [Massilia sp. CF038]
MHNQEQHADHLHLADLHLGKRWHRARAAYRMANVASHHVLGFVIKLALLAYFLFTFIFLFLRYAILPNIDYYKADIERQATRALGSEVSITRIYASWQGLRPNLFLGDVIVRDAQGRQALSLPSVSATLSWWSVLAASPRFDSLEIIRPDLDIRRDPQGRIAVAGILLDNKPGKGGGGDWILSQREVVIREGTLRWTDELRGAPELALGNVNLQLLNRWTHHRFGLRATPPASLSGPLDVRADFRHPRFGARVSDVAQWSGELYADVAGTDLAGWKAYVDYPFQISSGKGAVRAWLTLHRAKLAAFTADLALVDVSARLAPDLPPLALARVAGRLSASETFPDGSNRDQPVFGANGHTIALDNFSLTTTDGLTLAPTSISEAYTPARDGQAEKFHLSARQLDLATLAKLAVQLPLRASQRQMLTDFAPRGSLSDFSASWSGKYPAIRSYRVKGRLTGLGMNAQPARLAQPRRGNEAATAALPAIPGFDNLSGSIDATDVGGTLILDARDTVLQLPAWFDDPAMAFDELNLQARWSFAAKDQLLVQLDNMALVQGPLRVTLSGRHQLPLAAPPGKGAGMADLSGTINGFDAKTLGRYLPLQTPPGLHDWLVGAIQDGTLHDGSVRLRGDLAQFPFRGDKPQGEFRVAGRIENGVLNYTPNHFAADGKAPLWPLAEQINGHLLFERSRMEITAETASTLGVPLTKVKAVVADLGSPDRTLEIEGSAAGPMQDFLRYVDASPVAGWIGHFTEPTRATGNTKLGLRLQLPLTHLHDAKVQGSLQLLRNDVVLFPELPPLQAAVGKLDFTEQGLTLSGVGASVLGGPLALTGGSTRESGVAIRLSGSLSADGIRRNYAAPAMVPVVSRLHGSARYTGLITVRDGLPQITVDSALTGMGLEFPAPLAKAAADAMPLHFTLNGIAAGEGVSRDDIRIALGSTVAVRYQRQKLGKGAWEVKSGGVGVNVPAPEPDGGMMVNVSLRALNVDQWMTLASAVSNAKPEPVAAGAAPAMSLAQYVVPDVMAARADQLTIAGRKLDNVMVGVSHQNQTWQASIDARQVAGHLSWDEGAGGQGLGKVTARLAALVIPESSAADVKDLLEDTKSPAATIPALDIVAERFELFNKPLGRLELLANNERTAGGREWRINRLLLANPDGTLHSTGRWASRDGVSSTSINFELEIDDAGKLLDRFGFPDTLKRGKGTLSGDLAWNGVPYSLDIPSLSGKIDMNLASGQFLKKDPGAAKLLGVLSLQMLPRILKLDFHDVFSEGLAFDGITANATITRGLARTDNLKMWGVAATVLMDGTADIANETTNLHVVVIPEFNLGTGPLVYALAVNPVIGLGSFLAQLFLREPMMRALTYEMQVTGPWKAPVVTKLAGARATAAAEPGTAVPEGKTP